MSFGTRTSKRIVNTLVSVERLNALATDPWAGGGAHSVGNAFDGLLCGIATGFGADEAFINNGTLSRAVPAAGAYANPTLYPFCKHNLYLVAGGAATATTGLLPLTHLKSRGVLRLVAADNDGNNTAGIMTTEGVLSNSADWQVHFDVAGMGGITQAGSAGEVTFIVGNSVQFNIEAGAANGVALAVTGGKYILYSITSGARTQVASGMANSGQQVISFIYNSKDRRVHVAVDGAPLGHNVYVHVPTTVLTMAVGARAWHSSIYASAINDSFHLDLDGLIVNQLSSPQ